MKFEYIEAKSNYMKEVIYQDISYLKDTLASGEELEGVSVGVFQENYGIYGITNKRLLFCSVANGRSVLREYSLNEIAEVKLARTGLYNIRLLVHEHWHRLGLTWFAAKDFFQYIDEAIQRRDTQAA